ncbi:hypothetical protein Pcinc_017640 [Petrolisthes cinctipes]|uniref:Bardet-Biedl syndrome 1 N-terminal domain-containing protein n=1 Tax=Petrolisthes cinctipes TaxID=88211 RepID=A0AAE1KK97_PETCI|nr:hypothetical protein Pcinc_024209 [Petrolisthes cinctipes]KAK3877656.1 hypothetical protein Pcinc_017640 [Petrolisthes cinctipes]
MGEKSNSSERWLTAHHDPLASLYTFGSCMALADLHGDGDSKLIIADLGTGAYNMKLKVYKGTNLIASCTSCGCGIWELHLHLQKLKAILQTLEVNPTEFDAWNQARDELLDVSMLYEILDSLRQEVGECGLTTRSQRFLMCHDHASQLTFLEQHKGFLLKRQTVVTCFSTLKKSHAEDDAISCLVLGTESANIFILDPEAFTILNSNSWNGKTGWRLMLELITPFTEDQRRPLLGEQKHIIVEDLAKRGYPVLKEVNVLQRVKVPAS